MPSLDKSHAGFVFVCAPQIDGDVKMKLVCHTPMRIRLLNVT